VEFLDRLRREALHWRFEDFDLTYHLSTRPAMPEEYRVPDLVGLTFRLWPRPEGGWRYATVLDVDAVMRLGERFGLDMAEALALVDSHERMHIHLQLEGVPEEVEEEQSRFVDAVWLSFRHPQLAERLLHGEFGLVTRVHEDFWEMLLLLGSEPPA